MSAVNPPEPEAPTSAEPSGFATLGLSAAMMSALELAGYSQPTPVQAGLIPRALAGVDVMAQARTGTGKTASFAIPILEKLELHKHSQGPQAIVLVPTRELAVQVRDEFVKLAHGRRVHVMAAYGGKPIRGQIEKLKKGADVVVGTPGRVIDLLDRQALQLDHLRLAVLDEADRMLDIGFRPDIENILRRCPQSRQTLLLSATVPKEVERLAKRYMRDNETLNFSANEVSVETIDQYYFTVPGEQKFDLLLKLLEREQPRQAIVFCRTKRGTEKVFTRLQKQLGENDVGAIHGDLNQSQRDRAMLRFREGKMRYLIATDVVGRGIDVSNISHIINYDIPEFCDDYVHRVGRTGRMGREGVAYSFVTPEEGAELTRIEMRINRLLMRAEMAGLADHGRARDHHARQAAAAASDAAAATVPSKYRISDGSTPVEDSQANVSPSNPPAAAPPANDSAAEDGSSKPTKKGKRYRRAL
jgi:ATP-dependent RNA helicase DeaD